MREMNQNDKGLEISEEKSIKTTNVYLKNVKINQESYEAKILSEENIENVIKLKVSYYKLELLHILHIVLTLVNIKQILMLHIS